MKISDCRTSVPQAVEGGERKRKKEEEEKNIFLSALLTSESICPGVGRGKNLSGVWTIKKQGELLCERQDLRDVTCASPTTKNKNSKCSVYQTSRPTFYNIPRLTTKFRTSSPYDRDGMRDRSYYNCTIQYYAERYSTGIKSTRYSVFLTRATPLRSAEPFWGPWNRILVRLK